MTARFARRFLFRSFLVLLGVVILGVMVLMAGIFYLRTPSGEAFLARTLVDTLKSAGIAAQFQELQGPFPERLMLRGVRLEDDQGLWLEASELEIRLALPSLLGARLEIAGLETQGIHFIRPPVFAASSEEPEPSGGAGGNLLPFLPFSVALEKMSIRETTLGEAVLGQPVTFDADGSMLLRAGRASGHLDVQTTEGPLGRFGVRLALETSSSKGEALLSLRAEATPGTQLAQEARVLLGTGGYLNASLSVPPDLSSTGKYVLRSLIAAAPAWNLAIGGANLDLQKEAQHLEGEVTLVVTDMPALAPVVDLPMQSARLHSTLMLTLRGQTAEALLNGALSYAHDDIRDGSGAFRWTTRADWSGEALPQVDSVLNVSALGMKWPSPELNAVLGTGLVTKIRLTGGEKDSYTLSVNALQAGSVNASALATLAFAHTDRSLLMQQELEALQHATLTARLEAELDDVGKIFEKSDDSTPPPLAGPLLATVNVKGDVNALQADFSLGSSQVKTPSGTLSEVMLTITAQLRDLLAQEGKQPRAAGEATFHSTEAFGTPLDLSFSWEADPEKGAIRALKASGAGVIVSGDVSGSFAAETDPVLSGALSGQVDDWTRLSDLAGLGIKSESARFSLSLAEVEGKQSAAAEIVVDKADLNLGEGDRASLDKLTVTADVRDLFLTRQASLHLVGERGSVGPLFWSTAEISATGDYQKGDFSMNVSQKGAAPPRRGTELLRPATSLAGNYRLDTSEVSLQSFRLDLPQKKISLRSREVLRIGFAQGVSVDGLRLDLGQGGALNGRAFLGEGRTELDLAIQNLPLSLLSLATTEPIPEGRINVNARLRSENNVPSGTFSLTATAAAPMPELVAPQNVALRLDGQLRNARLTGTGSVGLRKVRKTGKASAQGAVQDVRLSFDIPMQANAQGLPLPNRQAPLAANLTWQGDVAPLWKLVPLADRNLSGQAGVKVALAGTLDNPTTDISASLNNGRYDDKVLGVLLTDMNLQTRQGRDGRVNTTFSAADGRGGMIDIQAGLTNPLKSPVLTLQGTVKGLSPLHRDDLSIRLSGPFSLDGSLTAPRIKAAITVDQGEFRLLQSLGAGVRSLDVVDARDVHSSQVSTPEESIALDVQITIPRRFFIRGRGLDSEWEGELHVGGAASSPVLTGSLRPVRGQFELLSRTFMFSEGTIAFQGNEPPDPDLNLDLTYESSLLAAVIKVGGTASHPALSLESRPAMPQDEIMAAILFGKRASDLSRFEILQVANGLRVLAGVGDSGFDPLTTLRRTLGIDVLRVGGGSDSSGRSRSGSDDGMDDLNLEAGKYVLDNVYVGVIQGATDGSTGVRVEVELLPNLTIEGRSTSTSSEVGVGWKRDY